MLKLLNNHSLLCRPHSVKFPWLDFPERRLLDGLGADREPELVDVAIDDSVDVVEDVALF